MRKLVAGLFISLDGVVEAPERWQSPYFNEEMGQAVAAQMAAADTMLKQQPGRNISITGSATLVRSLLHDGLLDELRLLVCPIVVGRGRRLFEDMSDQVPMKLVDATPFRRRPLAELHARAQVSTAEKLSIDPPDERTRP